MLACALVSVDAYTVQKRTSSPLGVELEAVLSHLRGAGRGTQAAAGAVCAGSAELLSSKNAGFAGETLMGEPCRQHSGRC